MPQKPGFPWPVSWPEVLPRQTNGDPLYIGFDPAAPGSDRSVGYYADCGETATATTNEDGYCPNKASHLLGPSGYVERTEWAEEMRKTHRQERCPGCGLWVIWRPKAGHSCINQEDSHAGSD